MIVDCDECFISVMDVEYNSNYKVKRVITEFNRSMSYNSTQDGQDLDKDLKMHNN